MKWRSSPYVRHESDLSRGTPHRGRHRFPAREPRSHRASSAARDPWIWPLLLVVAGIERLFARQRPQFALGLQTAAVALGVALIATQPLTHVTDKSSAIAGAPEVVVTATDFRFTPDELRLSADVANLTFRNDGVLAHDLTIPSLGVELMAKSGQAVTTGLRDLPRGVHHAYCSVDGHDDAGMRMTIRVD